MRRLQLVLPVVAMVILVMLAGCGASKDYVDEQIAGEKARAMADNDKLTQDIAATKQELANLQSLTTQLEKKADMAINEAKGFENYKVIWEGEVYFDFNSDAITADAQTILDEAGDKMVANRGSVMELAGYTDPTGSKNYNMDLGNRRAMAAKYYLVDNFGVNLYRVFFVSHGENKSVEFGDGKVSYAKQRRVKLKLWAK